MEHLILKHLGMVEGCRKFSLQAIEIEFVRVAARADDTEKAVHVIARGLIVGSSWNANFPKDFKLSGNYANYIFGFSNAGSDGCLD